MTTKILVIEDDTDILNLIDWHLRGDGYQTLTSVNGSEGLEMAIEQRPDLIILDLMLPGMDGLEVCKTLKRNESTENARILMLTAKGEEVDRIVGFELGADDYLVKPFSPRELLLRIRAILKRSAPAGENTALMRHKDLVIDPDRYQVHIGNEAVQLTLTEFNLLLDLVRHKGKVRTRDQLLDRVWGYQFDGYARTVDTHVRRLRQKINPYSDDIETIRGLGYRFTES